MEEIKDRHKEIYKMVKERLDHYQAYYDHAKQLAVDTYGDDIFERFSVPPREMKSLDPDFFTHPTKDQASPLPLSDAQFEHLRKMRKVPIDQPYMYKIDKPKKHVYGVFLQGTDENGNPI